jgi:hypothetical protein
MMEPKMAAKAKVVILAADLMGVYRYECGIVDKIATSIAGAVAFATPLKILYNPDCDPQIVYVGTPQAAGLGGFAAAGLCKQSLEVMGYRTVTHYQNGVEKKVREPVSGYKRVTIEKTERWIDPLVFTLEDTRSPQWAHLNLACTYCGQKSSVQMPGEYRKGRRHGEPWCDNCKGLLRLLPTRPKTEEIPVDRPPIVSEKPKRKKKVTAS